MHGVYEERNIDSGRHSPKVIFLGATFFYILETHGVLCFPRWRLLLREASKVVLLSLTSQKPLQTLIQLHVLPEFNFNFISGKYLFIEKRKKEKILGLRKLSCPNNLLCFSNFITFNCNSIWSQEHINDVASVALLVLC